MALPRLPMALVLAVIALLALASPLPFAGTAAAVDPVFVKDGVAIRGYDPVAYFTRGRPVPGDATITHIWQRATWRFESEANRAAFAAAPERWAPRYGGWCAWAVSRGYTAATVPDARSIVDGRLYLNYSTAVRADWERNIPGNIETADANWPSLQAR